MPAVDQNQSFSCRFLRLMIAHVARQIQIGARFFCQVRKFRASSAEDRDAPHAFLLVARETNHRHSQFLFDIRNSLRAAHFLRQESHAPHHFLFAALREPNHIVDRLLVRMHRKHRRHDRREISFIRARLDPHLFGRFFRADGSQKRMRPLLCREVARAARDERTAAVRPDETGAGRFQRFPHRVCVALRHVHNQFAKRLFRDRDEPCAIRKAERLRQCVIHAAPRRV